MIKFEQLPADILSRLREAEKVLAADEDVVFAYLFGGLARGRVKPLSDVDLAVYLREGRDAAAAKMRLFERLSDALGTEEIDLVVLNTAPISIVGRILRDKRILADKEPFLRHRFESIRSREFFDFSILEEGIVRRRYAGGR